MLMLPSILAVLASYTQKALRFFPFNDTPDLTPASDPTYLSVYLPIF